MQNNSLIIYVKYSFYKYKKITLQVNNSISEIHLIHMWNINFISEINHINLNESKFTQEITLYERNNSTREILYELNPVLCEIAQVYTWNDHNFINEIIIQ